MTDSLFERCPVCGQSTFKISGKTCRCADCGLALKSRRGFLGLGSREKYLVQDISAAYSLAKSGLVGRVFSRDDVGKFAEKAYSDDQYAAFAAGNFEDLMMPTSLLSQILLKQLRETCYIEVTQMRHGRGPVLEPGGSYVPQGRISASSITWKDKGNLFLTDARLVFPSDTFTFIRMDRKLVGLKTFENGIALQRKGEAFAVYFSGCRPYEAALLGAYIQGRVSGLREVTVA